MSANIVYINGMPWDEDHLARASRPPMAVRRIVARMARREPLVYSEHAYCAHGVRMLLAGWVMAICIITTGIALMYAPGWAIVAVCGGLTVAALGVIGRELK